jgi:hypothetical protein
MEASSTDCQCSVELDRSAAFTPLQRSMEGKPQNSQTFLHDRAEAGLSPRSGACIKLWTRAGALKNQIAASTWDEENLLNHAFLKNALAGAIGSDQEDCIAIGIDHVAARVCVVSENTSGERFRFSIGGTAAQLP